MITLIETYANDFIPSSTQDIPYCYTPHWSKLYKDIFRYIFKMYQIRDNNTPIGIFCFVIIKSYFFGNRIISMPISDEGGITLYNESSLSKNIKIEILQNILYILDATAKSNKILFAELRGYNSILHDNLVPDAFIMTQPYVRFLIDTTIDYSKIKTKFSSNIVKNLKKANKFVRVEKCSSIKEIHTIYQIYLKQMRFFGSPPLPKEYFTYHFNSQFSKIFFATLREKGIIAFIMLLQYNKNIYADLNASFPNYNNYFPKIKLFAESIKYACESSFKTYDFMRTRQHSSVYKHKQKWGGKETPIYYYYRNYKKNGTLLIDPQQKRFFLPKLIFRHLPFTILKKIGPFLRKDLGK